MLPDAVLSATGGAVEEEEEVAQGEGEVLKDHDICSVPYVTPYTM